MRTNRHASSLILASILLIFSATGFAGGFISKHHSSVNLSVGFNNHNAYGHRANIYNYGQRYQPRRFFKPRSYNQTYNRGFNQRFNQRFNQEFRSGYSRSYCPSRY